MRRRAEPLWTNEVASTGCGWLRQALGQDTATAARFVTPLALCPRGDAGRLHPKLEVADMHVQQMGDTQPGNAVGINGGPGL